jgi:hypothetical protein
MLKPKSSQQSKQWMHTHSPNKPQNFKQTVSACQKADSNCFLGQQRSADDGIRATRDNVRSVSRNTKKNCMGPFRKKKRRGMLKFGVVLLHDNALPHTAARTRALLEHFNWELSDHRP